MKNAKEFPKVFYGLHFCEGIAQYQEEGFNNGEPFRILVKNEAMRKMNKTFVGKPVFVEHVDEVELETLEQDADGYVIESFYNECDGKHWAKFIVTTEEGQEAIRKGYKLSNSYLMSDYVGGGTWHNVDYIREVTNGEYDHLAIVKNPRYEESVIMTPEEFREYNERMKEENYRIANSKKEKGMLNFFKREKLDNSADLEGTVVELPKSKKEMSISELVEAHDKVLNEKDKPKVANETDKVKVGDQEMTVAQLVEKYENAKKKNEEMEKEKENEEEVENEDDKETYDNEEEEVENEEDEKEDNEEEEEKENKKKNSKEQKKDNSKKNKLKNAHLKKQEQTIMLNHNKIQKGKSLFGSDKE